MKNILLSVAIAILLVSCKENTKEKVIDALISEMKLTEKKVSLKDLDKYYDDVLSSDMPEKDKK